MFILPILLIGIILFLAACLLYDRFHYFSNRSIPCPPISSIIFGHLSDLWSAKSYSGQLHKWTQQYGSMYGLFEGTRPVYVTSDIKFMQEILITQFTRFHARRMSLANRILGKEHFNVLSANTAQLWKKQRKILNPTFSGAKMKRLLPTIETCINIFIERLSLTMNGTIINIYEIYKRLTMDVICKFYILLEFNLIDCVSLIGRCAFSIDTQVQYDVNNNNIYMKKIEEFFSNNFEHTFLAKIHRITSHTQLANISSVLFRLKQVCKSKNSSLPAQFWLVEHMHEFIQQRFIDINQKKSVDDILQLMIDSVHSDKVHRVLLVRFYVNRFFYLNRINYHQLNY